MAIGGRRWGRAMGRGARGGRGATVLRKGNSATPSRPSLPGRHAISTPRAPLGPAATKCAGSADACVRACPLPPPSSLSVCLSHQGTYLCCGVASLSRRRLRRGSLLLLARVRSLSLLLTGRGGARFCRKGQRWEIYLGADAGRLPAAAPEKGRNSSVRSPKSKKTLKKTLKIPMHAAISIRRNPNAPRGAPLRPRSGCGRSCQS